MTIEATETEAATVPVFHGTPDDWWEQATQITEAEANNRNLGDWYITQVRTAGDTKPGYRVSTPSKPFNSDQLLKALRSNNGVSERVRRLIHQETPAEPWMASEFVMADMEEGSADRGPWRRMNSGRWQRITDARISVNDHTMRELNPVPGTFTTA
ncbi:hypothetical protein WMO79_00965 [Micrococcaceae bacterium Sec7.4]